jgi:hypothetical protein
MVQQGMHIAAHTGTEMAVKNACTIGLMSWSKVTKGEKSSGKQTATVYATHYGIYAQNTRSYGVSAPQLRRPANPSYKP